jgi:hypothetical protein
MMPEVKRARPPRCGATRPHAAADRRPSRHEGCRAMRLARFPLRQARALVVPKPGTAADAAALDAHGLAHIARFERSKRCLFVDALPKNRTARC